MHRDRNRERRFISQDTRLNYPSTREGLVIPVSTWNGFIQRVEGSRQQFRPWSITYSVLFGIGITAGLSIAPLLIADASLWIVAIYMVASATSMIVGVALIFMERHLARHLGSHIDQLADEMVQLRDESLDDESAS